MLSLVLSVVMIIIKVNANDNATENPEVRLFYSNDGNKNYTVWKNKPLTIVIENGYPLHVWCRSKYAQNQNMDDFIPTIEFNNDIVAKLSIENVTAEMSTRWACTVLKNYVSPGPKYVYGKSYYTAKDLFFNLYVRGAKAVILSANNCSLTYATTDLSVNYDGEASYTYVEGEDLEISCNKAQYLDSGGSSTLRLEYYNAAGILLFKTKSRVKKPHLFRTVLKSDNNNYYLDCIRDTEFPRREYRYRITFLKKIEDLQIGADQREMILSVNGHELTPTFHKDSSYDDYTYRYIGEGLWNVTCQKKDNTVQGTLALYSVDKKYVVQTLGRTRSSESGKVISANISTSNLTNKTLICGINNTDVGKSNAKILFLHDELRHDIRILGLPGNNILYQYTNDEKRWTIEYQYSVNDSFNLTCKSNGRFQYQLGDQSCFEWIFQGKSYESLAKNLPTYTSIIKSSQEPFVMNLDATHNTTKLRCIYFPYGKNVNYENESVEVIFRLKSELVAEANEKETSTLAEDQEVPIVPIAVSVGSAIGIITIICVVLWRKRIKRTHLIESEYDNLSNENDSPIPAFPSQWEANCDDSHYAKIDEGVMEENDTYTTDTDKLYSIPYNRQSNISENHYTEIDDYLKPKHAVLGVNWNSAHPSNLNKEKGTTSHRSNNATQNNLCDSIQDTYDKLRHDNSPINKSNDNYSNVQKSGKSKTVTFRQISNDLGTERNYSEGPSRQKCGNNDRRLKQNSDGHYANVSQDIYMEPGNLHKKPIYENHFLHNEKSENSVSAEPYGDLEVSRKNDFYG